MLGLLFLFLTLYVSGKVSPKISALLMKNLAPDVLARTSNFLGLLFTLSIPVGTACFSLVAVWNIQLTLDAICWSFLASYSFDSY